MEKYCIVCGMPLEKPEDVAVELEQGPACRFCAKPDGTVYSCKEIFEGGVRFFMKYVPDGSRKTAERVVRKNMKRLPYWRGKKEKCLEGEEATDKEFKKTLDKLHEEIAKGNVNV